MPIREYAATVQETADSEPVQITILASPAIAQLPPDEARGQLDSLLSQIRLRPEIKLYEILSDATFDPPPSRSALFGKNTRVELNLGYCLHVPDGFATEVALPDGGIHATVQFRKCWTESASGSSRVEAYAADQVIYQGPFEILAPATGQGTEQGPWPLFRAKNVEVEKDTRGVFRFSRLRVFFDTDQQDLVNVAADHDVRKRAVANASEVAVSVVNYVLDVYRYVTGETHTERVWLPVITQVFFADHNLAFEGATIPHGLRSAIVNRSKKEIQRIASMLSRGDRPNADTLLLYSARAALDRREPLTAVIVAFQALEIYLETRLRDGFQRRGLGSTEITQKLKEVYKTKDRLTRLCTELTGRSVADDSQFWNDWLTDCNRRRNEAVHRNIPTTMTQAERVVSLCEECIKRIGLLPFPQ